MPQAILERSFGGPEVLSLENTGLPQLGEDEVLVAVYAAGVNPVDAGIRQGYMNFPLPLVPGCDIAGIVEDTGARAGSFHRGDEVYGMIGFSGGYAEHAVVKESCLAPKPGKLDFTQAAAVPLASLAAWQSLFDLGGLSEGQKILIHGAAGGVGGFAVQFARNAGAYVIGTCTAEDSDYVRALGAHETIDYRAVRFDEFLKDLDLVFDVIGGETQERSWTVLKDGGTLVTTKNAPSEEKARARHAKARRLSVHPDGDRLRGIGALIDAGKVKVLVSRTFPLAQAGEAQRMLQTSHSRGKIVLVVKQ